MAPKEAARKPPQSARDKKAVKKGHDDPAKQSSRKRKAQDSTGKEPAKASRRSSRTRVTANIDPVKVINFLLSAEALPLCRPKDESKDLESRPKDTRTYNTATLTPFEELAAALILSRPIGHALGLRSIRTLFNEPHNLTTPSAIKRAGKEGCRVILDEARTQHRQKTAEELHLLSEAVEKHLGETKDDVDLLALRDASGKDVDQEREMLKKHVKGLAKTGIDIFARRIQAVWPEWYPFLDDRSTKALKDLGLESDGQKLKVFLETHWDEIEKRQFVEKGGDLERKVFAKVSERALGAGLEGNVDEVKSNIEAA